MAADLHLLRPDIVEGVHTTIWQVSLLVNGHLIKNGCIENRLLLRGDGQSGSNALGHRDIELIQPA